MQVLDDVERAVMRPVADGTTMDRVVQAVHLPRSTIAWWMSLLRDRSRARGPRLQPWLVRLPHALGGILSDGHPCRCGAREHA
ncbi:hypothetical protein [Kitasatospora purpeofusca]|uniref:hypothetical protein n=1 Tax=Kitasatospora purpeofusca TaxID=67352 RepID=UPI003F4ACBF0